MNMPSTPSGAEARQVAAGGLAYDYATNWSWHPAELLTLFVPGFFGFRLPYYWGLMEPWTDSTVYVGLLPRAACDRRGEHPPHGDDLVLPGRHGARDSPLVRPELPARVRDRVLGSPVLRQVSRASDDPAAVAVHAGDPRRIRSPGDSRPAERRSGADTRIGAPDGPDRADRGRRPVRRPAAVQIDAGRNTLRRVVCEGRRTGTVPAAVRAAGRTGDRAAEAGTVHDVLERRVDVFAVAGLLGRRHPALPERDNQVRPSPSRCSSASRSSICTSSTAS